eukprot:TRINITY_DN9591_c0_g1_i1.p2 TRINITY_DN9591_c0_g1~~TRINITY_DN9591_c0_g1_i1.p2  ORF type:complete len:517 (+),score=59.39 TRINITY_DN9591_c0_g1_i1:106-1656(+)
MSTHRELRLLLGAAFLAVLALVLIQIPSIFSGVPTDPTHLDGAPSGIFVPNSGMIRDGITSQASSYPSVNTNNAGTSSTVAPTPSDAGFAVPADGAGAHVPVDVAVQSSSAPVNHLFVHSGGAVDRQPAVPPWQHASSYHTPSQIGAASWDAPAPLVPLIPPPWNEQAPFPPLPPVTPQSLKAPVGDPSSVPAQPRPLSSHRGSAVHPVGPIADVAGDRRIGLITPMEGDPKRGRFYEMCSFSKACYAQMHNVSFVLDRAAYSETHRRHRTWNRVPSLQRYLGLFDWLLYLDGDIAVANYSISLNEFVSQFPPDAWLVFTDASTGFNAGAFFIRNTPFAHHFLQRWWDTLPGPHPGGTAGFNYNDQVAAWDVLVDMMLEDPVAGRRCPVAWRPTDAGGTAGPKPRAPCRSAPLRSRQDWQRAMDCWIQVQHSCGYGFGHGDMLGVHYWNPMTRWPRGFTFFYPNKPAMGTWPRVELFSKGDFVIHTRVASHMRDVGAYDEMKQSAYCTDLQKHFVL